MDFNLAVERQTAKFSSYIVLIVSTSANLVSNAMSSRAASSYMAESPSGLSRERTVTNSVFSA